jgi:hypothetical protein
MLIKIADIFVMVMTMITRNLPLLPLLPLPLHPLPLPPHHFLMGHYTVAWEHTLSISGLAPHHKESQLVLILVAITQLFLAKDAPTVVPIRTIIGILNTP